MADDTTTANPQPVRNEDLVPVYSRVSWGAVLAGAVVAMAAYLVLTLLGAAIGLSITDNLRDDTFQTAAAIWAVVTTVIALFLGGWVTSQCAVGENKTEAMVHGIIMWGVVLGILMWMVSSGVRTGFGAMVGMTHFSQAVERDGANQADRAGVPRDPDVEKARAEVATAPEKARRIANDPDTHRAVTQMTWWTLLGTLLSMAASALGAVAGSGPAFRLFTVNGVVAGRTTLDPTRPPAGGHTAGGRL